MKLSLKNIAGAAIIAAACALPTACSQKAPSELVPVVNMLDKNLCDMAKNNPLLLNEASASLDSITSDVTVAVSFCDSIFNVDMMSDALVEYYTAQQLKDNPGKNLDAFLNTMSADEGTLTVTMSDVYGHTRSYAMSGARLKQLFKSAPMQLSFNDVKNNVVEILSSRCDFYKDAANAQSCSFDIENGFATYTLAFSRESNYANLTQGSLKGRYLHFLTPAYQNMGELAAPVQEMLKTLQIDGYRFVYTTTDGKGKELRAAIPWREI
ncbi:MAG: hypothetical protein K2L96_06010 [Muribaculaceae bacterium]|nr:hypothetical protein [Muribaculaceae bacterium]